jgi:phage shock protein PspC (stress-responsive transcriptional regulator)|tara:strand:+ start:5966 stop:6148 length:183 start_codon:yes stop_codon:yes gene_type:complete
MKLFKNKEKGMIFGVCAGISENIGIDVRIIRLLMVLGVFASFSVLFWVYLFLGIILPNKT